MIDQLKSNAMVSIARQMKMIKEEVNERFPDKAMKGEPLWDLLEKIMLKMYESGFDDGIDASLRLLEELKHG